MKLRLLLAGLAIAGFTASASVAQEGQYGPALKKIIDTALTGKCDAELMQPSLLEMCEAQIAQMGPGLAMLGTVQSVTYVSEEDSPQGRVETYTVAFSSGETMNWIIGGRSEGKFAVIGTAG